MADYREEPTGVWLPAIPLPLFGIRKRCDCGRRFRTLEGYQGHYALKHWPLDLRDTAMRMGGQA